ncbi:hypothetical protein LSH36_100g11012 [Paralvinella palmiformis]|uniref:Uncharacterized protein n=1 Tax=Paralvinella palmiformis TaxID=53620 RepID=A0AAD9K1S8_9ANNE|nr:hypothetical protein LSH36_100g11012 [Paralvinella palmiformis]
MQVIGVAIVNRKIQTTHMTTLCSTLKAFSISDDILVHGCTQAEHDDNLGQVFKQMRASNITLSREKSIFGHVWSPEGVSADPQTLEAIRKMKTPGNGNHRVLADYHPRKYTELIVDASPVAQKESEDKKDAG